MSTFSKDATVVLVHGAWADCSSWNNVIMPLRKSGLNIACAPIPLTSLTDDISALNRMLERTKGSLVLAGHAYGGAVIGGIENDRIKGVVYIAALAPDEGETVAEVFYREKPHPQSPELAPDSHGYIWMPESGFGNAFAPKAPADLTTILSATQRPISVRCIQEKAPAPNWKKKPSWFLIAEEDRMINPKTQYFMAQRMGARANSQAVDHSPSVTAPDCVIEVILQAAKTVLAN